MGRTTWTLIITFMMIFIGDILLGADGNFILKKMKEAQNYETMESVGIMIVYSDKKETAKMKMKSYYKKDTEDKQLIRYTEPKRLDGTAILMNGDKIWYYNKRTNRVRLLSESAKKGSMMGSSFSYDDMTLDYVKDFDAKILKENKKDYILKVIPKKSKKYSYLIAKVDKETYVEDYMEYYDENDIMYKKMLNNKSKKINGVYIPLEIEMLEMTNGKSTKMITDEKSIKLNKEIKDSFFSERKLRK